MAYQPYSPIATPPTDLNVNQYSNVGGGTQSQKVISDLDFYKPNELIQVYARHNETISYRAMMKAMGFSRGTAAPTIGHYEYPWNRSLVEFGAIVTAAVGAGNPIVVSISAAYMYDAQVTSNGVAQLASYPIKNEVIRFPDGTNAHIIDKDTTTNPAFHQLTLLPADATVDLDAVVAVDTPYFVATNAHGEGSGLPSGRVPRVIKYNNCFQIIKSSCSATGSSMTNQTYFDPLPGQPGSFYLKTKDDTYRDYERKCDGALLWGQKSDNPALSEFNAQLGFDVPIETTQGMISFAETSGNTTQYVSGSYTLSDFDTLSKYYEGQRIGTRQLQALQGVDINIEIENVLAEILDGDLAALLTKDYYTMGGIYSDEFQPMDSSDFALKMGFRAVKKSNFTYSWMMMHCFNDVVGAGSPDYPYSKWQVIYPVGYATDTRTGNNMPTVGYEYKSLNGYSRESVIAQIAGVGVAGTGTPYAIASNQFDIHTLGIVSEIAFHGACANHITLQTPAP
jgi:hypothetical protein